jgi:uncharacterized membrane protein YjjP (DUF1212 family)/uncharacterized membrane protein YjjB (DUF3815 family)
MSQDGRSARDWWLAPLPTDPGPHLSIDEARLGIRFAVELGRQMLHAGFETVAIDIAMLACLHAFGMRDAQVQIAGGAIHVQAHLGDVPLAMFAATQMTGGYDLARMDVLDEVVADVVTRRRTPSEAMGLLRRAEQARAPWPWWVSVGGGGVLAASITLQSRGTVAAAALAMLLLVVVNRVGWLLARWQIPRFHNLLVQAWAVVTAGVALADSGLPSASLVAANLVLMLPIPAIVAFAEDGITGFAAVAAARAVTIVMAVSGIFAGVAIAAVLSRQADLAPAVVALSLPPAVTLAAAVVGAVGNAVFMNGGARLLLPATLAGLLAGSANMVARYVLLLPGPLATGIAATVLGAAAVVMSPKLRVPATQILIAGITGALLPGLDVYRALVLLTTSAPGEQHALLSALATTATIGAGAVLGASFALRRRANLALARITQAS